MTTLAKPPLSPTRNGLLPEARHLVVPSGIVATGFPATQATCRQIGIEFDPYQVGLNRCILAKDRSGLYAADTVAMSIPRQVGKTFDVGALQFADCIIFPGTTVVWTAHRFKVARETFDELRSWAKSKLLEPHIDYDDITTAAGNECIPFRNGSRIVFAARERGAVRGFTKVRKLVLDEGQILSEAAMADLAPTANQGINPQVIIMGTPPKPTDPGDVFTEIRRQALAGESEGVLYVEFSADPDADPLSWEAVAQANPSFPKRTNKRAILRLRKLLTNADDFRREALGVWDEDGRAGVLIGWTQCVDRSSQVVDEVHFGIAVALDRATACIGAAGPNADARIHLEVTGHDDVTDHRPGTDWVAARAKELQDAHGGTFAIDGHGPAAPLIPELEALRVRLHIVHTGDLCDACAWMFDAVKGGTVRHLDDPVLNAAVSGAQRRPVGDRWAWGRKQSTSDVTPLEAVTLACWGHRTYGGNLADSVW